MQLDEIIESIKSEINDNAEGKIKEYQSDYHELPFFYYGLKTPLVRSIGKKYFKKLKKFTINNAEKILDACNRLLSERIVELRTIAFQWAFRIKDESQEEHFKIFRLWLEEYVTGWGSCDDLCTHALGYIVYKYPSLFSSVKTWTQSNNIWFKRAAAVSLIYGLRRKCFLKEAFIIAEILLEDKEKYVRKGYGWMLKEAANNFQREVFNFVIEHKEKMPRVSLRYAIEKMPDRMKKNAME